MSFLGLPRRTESTPIMVPVIAITVAVVTMPVIPVAMITMIPVAIPGAVMVAPVIIDNDGRSGIDAGWVITTACQPRHNQSA